MATTEQLQDLLSRITGSPEGFGVVDPLTIACENAMEAVEQSKAVSVVSFLEEIHELDRPWNTNLMRGITIGIGLMLRSEKRSADAWSR